MFHLRDHDMITSLQLSDIFGQDTVVISPNMIMEQITIDILIAVALWFILCLILSWGTWGVVSLCSWLVLRLFNRFVCPSVRSRAVCVILPLLAFVCWLFSPFLTVDLVTFIIVGIILVVAVLWNTPTHSQTVEENLILLQEETSKPVTKEEDKPAPVPEKKKAPVKTSAKKGKTSVKTQKAKAPAKKAPAKTVRRTSDKKSKGKAGVTKK